MFELSINGKSIGPAEIKALKPGVTVADAQKAFRRDGYDQVVFKQGDQLMVAYGRNLNIPAKWGGPFALSIPSSEGAIQNFEKDGKAYVTLRENGKPKDFEIPNAKLDGKAVTVEWVNDEVTRFKEGAIRRLKVAGIVTGAGAGLGGFVSAVSQAGDALARRGSDPVNGPAVMGVTAAIGAAIGGVVVLQGAIKGHRNQPNDLPIMLLTQH